MLKHHRRKITTIIIYTGTTRSHTARPTSHTHTHTPLSLSLVSLSLSVSFNVSDLRFPPVVIFRGCSWPLDPGALHRTLLHPTKRAVSVLWGTVPVPQLPSSKSGPKLPRTGWLALCYFFLFVIRTLLMQDWRGWEILYCSIENTVTYLS